MNVTDDLSIRFTVTPTRVRSIPGGSQGATVDVHLRYFPGSGRFTDMHVDLWGITSGFVMHRHNHGTGELVIGHTRRLYAKNDRDLSRQRPTVAVQLWAKLKGKWKWDAGKTADCIGRSGGDRRCYY